MGLLRLDMELDLSATCQILKKPKEPRQNQEGLCIPGLHPGSAVALLTAQARGRISENVSTKRTRPTNSKNSNDVLIFFYSDNFNASFRTIKFLLENNISIAVLGKSALWMNERESQNWQQQTWVPAPTLLLKHSWDLGQVPSALWISQRPSRKWWSLTTQLWGSKEMSMVFHKLWNIVQIHKEDSVLGIFIMQVPEIQSDTWKQRLHITQNIHCSSVILKLVPTATLTIAISIPSGQKREICPFLIVWRPQCLTIFANAMQMDGKIKLHTLQ